MKPYRYLLITAFSLSLFSCSKEADEREEPVDPDTPVALSPQIASIALTKADATSVNEIGLYAVNQTSSETDYGNHPNGTYGKYTSQSGSLLPATINGKDQTIWLSFQKAEIYSCHPAPDASNITVSGTTPATYTIPVPSTAITYSNTITDPSKLDFAAPANDYMYGVAYNTSLDQFTDNLPVADNGHGTSSVGPAIHIGLKHAFSKIHLVLKKGADYTGAAKVTKVSYIRSIPTLKNDNSSTMNLFNGELANLEAGKTDHPVTYTYTTNGGVTLSATTEGFTIINYGLPFTSGTANISNTSSITVTVDEKNM